MDKALRRRNQGTVPEAEVGEAAGEAVYVLEGGASVRWEVPDDAGDASEE